MFDKLRWSVADTCKRFFLMNLRTLRYLNKYLFKRKNYDILERYFENKYTIETENFKPDV